MKHIKVFLAAAFCGTFPLWGIGGLHAQSVVASGFCGKYVSNLSWVLTSDSVLRIYGSGDMHDYYAMHMDFPPWMDTPIYTYVIHVIIGDSVTSIGEIAFRSLDLTSVTIGKSVTKIGGDITHGGAFGNCKNLTSITVHAVTPPILGVVTFSGVSKTASVYVPCGTIPAYQTDWGYFSNFIEEFADTTYYSASFCQDSTYTDANFTDLAEAGQYYNTLQNVHGCDSIIELILTVNPIILSQICDSIYIGSSYNFHGKLLTKDGIYYDTLVGANGCDSIVELTLTVTGVGIVETYCNTSLRIYPNPTTGLLMIEIAGQARNDAQGVEIYSVVGQCVYTSPNPSKGGELAPSLLERAGGEVAIDISHLANGIYFLKMNNKIIKIIKQ